MRKRRLPFRKRTLRLWLGALVSFCLLLNQWAVAAYACPSDQVKLPCHVHVDKQQPGLCHQHCNPAPLSDVDGKAPTVPPALLPPLPPRGDHLLVAAEPLDDGDLSALIAASPPPLHRYCRYLI